MFSLENGRKSPEDEVEPNAALVGATRPFAKMASNSYLLDMRDLDMSSRGHRIALKLMKFAKIKLSLAIISTAFIARYFFGFLMICQICCIIKRTCPMK